MAHIRTYEELMALEPTEVEMQLIKAAKAGEPCLLGDGELPPDVKRFSPRNVRASILRYLILGGCEDFRVVSGSLSLSGARIMGTLRLDFIKVPAAIRLENNYFDSRISLNGAECRTLNLNGSKLSGIKASGIRVSGSVLIRNAISSGKFSFANAKIGAQLSCLGTRIDCPEGFSMNLQRAEISGGLFLHPTTKEAQKKQTKKFYASNGISLVSATLGGLYAEYVTIETVEKSDAIRATNLVVNGTAKLCHSVLLGEVRFTGAQITGDLSCEGTQFNNAFGHAFNGQRMQVDQSFIWKKVKYTKGKISLNGAHVAELDDDPENWPNAGDFHLDGFTYDRIRGKVSTSPARKQWLLNGSLYKEQFFPQPYTQYATFLSETGHDVQARKILLSRERLVRRYERKEFGWTHQFGFGAFKRIWRWFWDGLQLAVVGHGHAPFLSIGWLALLIGLAIIPAHLAWEEGSFAPNASPVLVSDDWKDLQELEPNPAKVWSGDEDPYLWRPSQNPAPWQELAPGRDWETFNRYAYAADIVIPLINFGQTEAWAPSTTREWWGWHLWWARWVFTVFGWIVTALGAAAITGIIRRE